MSKNFLKYYIALIMLYAMYIPFFLEENFLKITLLSSILLFFVVYLC